MWPDIQWVLIQTYNLSSYCEFCFFFFFSLICQEYNVCFYKHWVFVSFTSFTWLSQSVTQPYEKLIRGDGFMWLLGFCTFACCHFVTVMLFLFSQLSGDVIQIPSLWYNDFVFALLLYWACYFLTWGYDEIFVQDDDD